MWKLVLTVATILAIGWQMATTASSRDGLGQVADRPESKATDVPGPPSGQYPVGSANDAKIRFVRQVLADTEDVWESVFKAAGRTYHKPKLVVFGGATRTACGVGQTAMGPFYCPLDRTI